MHDHHEHININQPIDTQIDSGEVHVHSHGHGEHSHTHDPAEIKKIVNRIARSIGHLESVKRMVEDGRDCSDVLIQLSAVEAELNSTVGACGAKSAFYNGYQESL